MCLIVFAWQVIPCAPLVAAANRDEYYARPATPAGNWANHPDIYAGRDLQGGGSWMGIAQHGAAVNGVNGAPAARFAALTNIRSPQERQIDAPSRGALVADYLAGSMTPQQYVASIAPGSDAYNGFNLILADDKTLIWFSNRGQADARNGQPLVPGIYGVSNALLDTPWPKVVNTKAQFASLLFQCAPDDAYFEMLADTDCALDHRLPETGVPIELERALSAVCIDMPDYGTRTSTVVKLYADAPASLHEVLVR